MPTTLPLPIEFELPDGWLSEQPDEAGAPGVAFVAVHPDGSHGFTANITIDGGVPPDGRTITEIADGSVELMREVATSVALVERVEDGDDDVRTLRQQLSFTVAVDGERLALLQTQVYLLSLDEKEHVHHALVRLALTTTVTQYDEVVDDFYEVVRSVGLAPPKVDP